MNESKHTPGPWKMVHPLEMFVSDENEVICKIYLRNSLNESTANAELIASAPALLVENTTLRAEVDRLTKENEKFKRLITGIELMEKSIGREGCTYSDTGYDSPSAAYGYNECLEQVKDWIIRIK